MSVPCSSLPVLALSSQTLLLTRPTIRALHQFPVQHKLSIHCVDDFRVGSGTKASGCDGSNSAERETPREALPTMSTLLLTGWNRTALTPPPPAMKPLAAAPPPHGMRRMHRPVATLHNPTAGPCTSRCTLQAREEDAASVHGYTGTIRARSKVELKRERACRPGRRMRGVCTLTPVHYEQTDRDRVARPGRRIRGVCTYGE